MATVADIRAILGDLPGAVEVHKWGSPHVVVGEKLLGGLDEACGVVTLKASKDEQTALIASDPDTFGVAPYVGRYGWITVRLAGVDAEELRELAIEAWRRTAPRRDVKAFDAVAGAGG
jgi:hypothetical protein